MVNHSEENRTELRNAVQCYRIEPFLIKKFKILLCNKLILRNLCLFKRWYWSIKQHCDHRNIFQKIQLYSFSLKDAIWPEFK